MHLPIYVIHSPSLPERAIHVSHEMERTKLNWEWVTAYEVGEISPEIEGKWFTPGSKLSARQKSCALKHIVALEAIRDRDCERAIVFEDDIILCKNFISQLSRAMDESRSWKRPFVMDIGSATNFYTPADKLKNGSMLYAGAKRRNAEAYLIGSLEASLRLEWLAKHKITEPIDIEFNHCDAILGISIIWTEPPLAEQGSLTGKFKSSLDPKRRSHLKLRLQFPIQKFRRKYLKRWTNASRLSIRRIWRSTILDKTKH
ncbi:glycosyltransferase family 25 protein [Bradyrhizobium sp. 145]|uniref:glycosyltransferase family 25 protein n=1 Tax=Bradyrhizobium sp. 145 TaxID=2782621 RepID=UPI0021110E3B|nr:glycosyltransferase family 25 protein [Bradyrhizobium sp. 145]MCK1691623.1 glycosyltransferase family 25 protein [Bradyrhizobium sp. 145]